MVQTMLSLGVLAAFALLAGGLWLIVKRGERKNGILMLIAALVILANVAIWSVPLPDGKLNGSGSSDPAGSRDIDPPPS